MIAYLWRVEKRQILFSNGGPRHNWPKYKWQHHLCDATEQRESTLPLADLWPLPYCGSVHHIFHIVSRGAWLGIHGNQECGVVGSRCCVVVGERKKSKASGSNNGVGDINMPSAALPETTSSRKTGWENGGKTGRPVTEIRDRTSRWNQRCLPLPTCKFVR